MNVLPTVSLASSLNAEETLKLKIVFQRDFDNWLGTKASSLFGMGTLSSVLGDKDRREKVASTDSFPWSGVCSLMIESESGKRQLGTGWLAGPRTVITAGHCVYSKYFLDGRAKAIYVVPGRAGKFSHFYSALSSTFRTLEAWHEKNDVDSDIGCITLDQPFDGPVSCLSAFDMLPPDLTGREITISGYPSVPGGGHFQYRHTGQITDTSLPRAFYSVDTSVGQSGAPILTEDASTGRWHVLGVHTNGFDSRAAGTKANHGLLLSDAICATIRGWVTEDAQVQGEATG
jgi:glutamyl endopeptidase